MSIIDFFDKCRYWGGKRNVVLRKLYFYQAVNKLVDIAANAILPAYFRATKSNSLYALWECNKHSGRIVVSLTSFPVRLPKVWLVVECLLRQTVKPDRIMLYLSKEQVESVESLPKSLLALRKRGLEIVLCEGDLRSHKKYHYAFSSFPDDVIVTVDDDLFYRTDFMEQLLEAHKQNPGEIVANWVKEILPSKYLYKQWPDGAQSMSAANFVFIGVGGVLYPPHCLYSDVLDIKIMRELCFTADDVWLSCMALLKRTPVFFPGYNQNYLPVFIRNNKSLISVNRDLNQVQVDNLNKYYKKELGIAPFIDIE